MKLKKYIGKMEAIKIDQIHQSVDELHQLWTNLTSVNGKDLLKFWTELLKKYGQDNLDNMDEGPFDLIFPSDNEWQTKVYYKLVEKQRMLGSNNKVMFLEEEPRETKLHDWNIVPKPKLIVPSQTPEPVINKGVAPITWTVGDIAKAGNLLKIPSCPVDFEDEQEMRRVYTLIYDVFRYKTVLTQALNDIAFFHIYPKLAETVHHVWLLFFDLYHRKFKKRESKTIAATSKSLDSVGLSFAENALWCQRIRLAAAVARLRIKHNALSLDDLLPPHLKDEKVAVSTKNNPVTCWVNCLKITNLNDIIANIGKALDVRMINDAAPLESNTFKMDKHCPQVFIFHAAMREALTKSDFVKNNLIIVQDKSFCLGAASFGRVLFDLGLDGSVIQTHVNSPRTTAYLASLLSQNEKIKKLMAFSAGKRKLEYESYFLKLGITNIRIFSERFIDSPPDAVYMEEVVAVFATPPNSYSAVTDPIDLVCSRGGDLSMLEILTESEETEQAKERVIKILEEQKMTLRFALSRPQIQFVLYETHSEIEAENNGMVNKTLTDINKMAKLHHASLLGKIDAPKDNDEVQKAVEATPNLSAGEVFNIDDIEVPDTDVFELPDKTSSIMSKNEGCYLALMQRKEIIRLDDKYMIQMAENRGLFGTNNQQSRSKSKQTAKKKHEKSNRKQRPRKKLKDTEIDRIAAPTHTFLSHTAHETQLCVRCRLEQERLRTSRYKIWWAESTRHIIDLKRHLVKHKLLPNQQLKQISQKHIVNSLMATIKPIVKVDEVAKECNVNLKYPIFPKLRLSRENKYVKVPVPVAVTTVEFPEYCTFCKK